jgi:hypothetical protein
MNPQAQALDDEALAQVRPRKPPKERGQGPRIKAETSREARRAAACILEVLGGSRTPTQAAKELGVSIPRYYLLEARAFEGLLSACEPRGQGRVKSEASQLAQAQKEAQQLRQQCARYSALARVAQRTIGLSAPPPKVQTKAKGKGRGSRKPVVRALKAVERLREGLPEVASPGVT